MDKVVATDGEAVAVARHIPNGEVGTSNLEACSDSQATTMDGVHAVGVHIIWHTA